MPAYRFQPPPPAPYAADPARSRGRRWSEAESRSRTPFARDRDRVIHCSAFRRLKEKTQVFVAHEGDHFRTRLTHSLEVAQIARSIAHALGLDDDLAEAIALAHDLGHPPFGHAGEDQLDECMKAYGGFDHNVQTFRVVTELEHRYPNFQGLNLTWETLEGVVKHNGPVSNRLDRADDIAYNNHDVDDGVQAGLFDMDELAETPLIGPVIRSARSDYPGLEARLLRLEAVRRMIGAMVDDVMATTLQRAASSGLDSPQAVRALGKPLVAFSAEMAEDLGALREFLHTRMYRHYRVNRTRSQARRVLREMFELFLHEPDVLPTGWADQVRAQDSQAGRAHVVCDYIAGMTDRFAIEEHRKLFNLDLWNS